jgi:hypothetical protein
VPPPKPVTTIAAPRPALVRYGLPWSVPMPAEHTFTPAVYTNRVQIGKIEQINEILKLILDFLI